MIKKLSTLLTVFVFFGAMTINAAGLDTSIKLHLGQNSGLYQLVVADREVNQVVSVETEGGANFLILRPAISSFDPNSYWCVTVTQENKGQTPIYDFMNKGKQCFLDASMDLFQNLGETSSYIGLGGEIGGWAYSKTFEEGIDSQPQPLFSYFTHDSVVYIVRDGSLLKLQKQLGTSEAPANALRVKLVPIKGFQLTAAQINNKLGLLIDEVSTNNVKLTFVPDKNNTSIVNPFSEIGFKATDVEPGFVQIWNHYGKVDSLLYVDTSYTNYNGAKFLAFKHAKDASAISAISDQAKFEFTYFPTNDSLVIQVMQATYTAGADGSFKNAGPQTLKDQLKHTLGTLNIGVNTAEEYANNMSQGNFVTVQDLVKADQIRIVTIRDEKESDVNLGYKGCSLSSNLISLTDSVYTIQNAAGEYLAVPIANCLSGTTQLNNAYTLNNVYTQWISVEATSQDVNHMPAYQWVVLKSKTNKYFESTSPVMVFNREYPYVTFTVQLIKDTVKNVIRPSLLFTPALGAMTNHQDIGSGFAGGVTFNAVPDIKDATIGYKTLTPEQLKYETALYSLKYFNPYVKNMYVAKNGVNLTATGDSTATFAIKSIPDFAVNQPYGFGSTYATAQYVGRISTLATLVRTPYVLSTGNMDVGSSDNDPTRGDSVVATDNTIAVPFFFKENNHYNGEHYYALVVAEPEIIIKDVVLMKFPNMYPRCLKVGVSDDKLSAMLQLQCGCESRTSSFAIEITDLSLYRHFNNANLGEVEGTDSFKFVEKTRLEYLMDENNVNLQNKKWEADNNHTIDYLGIWTPDKASLNGKALGLRLDTVWVNRGLGLIKPQYLISVDRHEVAGTDTIPCTETTPHHDINGNVTDAKHCAHAIPGHKGYVYGKYLISFADSANIVPYTDVENGYYRLAFKPAIHMTDYLIMLASDDQLTPIDSLSPVALVAKYKATGYKGNGKVLDLRGDNHKNYTWSFRYTNPGKGAVATTEGIDNEFLIESRGFITGTNIYGNDIAPENAAWVKMQNGCLCLTNPSSEFNSAKTGGDGALIFNVKRLTTGDAMVTDAATVTASEFSVIAGKGQVTINGAVGKKVVVSNILGQTVANTVLTSDNATIAAPTGIVVVVVGGEAIKAVVK